MYRLATVRARRICVAGITDILALRFEARDALLAGKWSRLWDWVLIAVTAVLGRILG